MRLQRCEIDFDNLIIVLLGIIINFSISPQIIAQQLSKISHLSSARGAQVGSHLFVKGEDRGSSADLSSHVTDGPLAGARDGLRPLAEVFHNPAGPPFHRQDARQFEYHIFWRSPPAQSAAELHTYDAGPR